MRRDVRTTFNFHTGVWIQDDPTSSTGLAEAVALRPRSEPAPGRWTKAAPPVKTDERFVALIFWATVVIVIASIVVKSLATLGIGTVPLILLCCALAAHRARDLAVTDADRRLLEDPDDRDVCLVLMTIVRNGKVVGRDKGAVWFASGAIMYSGHRTSFVVGGEDMLPRGRWAEFQRFDGVDCLPETAVPLRLPSGHAYVRMDPLIDPKSASSAQEMRFLKALYDFRRRPPLSNVPRQWPPLE